MFRFQSIPQTTSFFAFHDGPVAEPRQLVLRSVGVPGLRIEDIELQRITGPARPGWPMQWYRWILKKDAIDAVVPPCLEEDDDDQAYSVRSGLVVMVVGSVSGYVICGGPDGVAEEKELHEILTRFVDHPFYAPVAAPQASGSDLK